VRIYALHGWGLGLICTILVPTGVLTPIQAAQGFASWMVKNDAANVVDTVQMTNAATGDNKGVESVVAQADSDVPTAWPAVSA
jgi:hypothetical protein